jgi:hypothetical protein
LLEAGKIDTLVFDGISWRNVSAFDANSLAMSFKDLVFQEFNIKVATE